MSKKRDLRKALSLVDEARELVTAHLDPPFYDFVFEDFNALRLTLKLLAQEADHTTPPNTGPPPPG